MKHRGNQSTASLPLQSIRVLWRQPDTMALWGIPYNMRPGQQPYDLWRANNTGGWIWLGSPGWWGHMTQADQESVKSFLKRWAARIPQGPAEWDVVE